MSYASDIMGVMPGIKLHIQPFFVNHTGEFELESGEVLVRHHNPHITALDILDTFDTLGMSAELDLAILDNVCKNKLWERVNSDRISVNVHPKSIARAGFADKAAEVMESHGAIDHILLEINEDSDFSNRNTSINLNRLSSAGVKLALDDFNMCYDWYTAHRQFNFDSLKFRYNDHDSMDKELEIIDDCLSRVSVDSLGFVVECVSSNVVFKALRDRGIKVFQGFMFGRPEYAIDLS